ncbi:hypothetical protein [Magnetospirillum molischianum]|uniref:Tail assembly chaperone n=1 Tax=Magnetospirillum molischianum DSM 120 TaxID=1150626 RepID=H8FY56_MAGML|nr:hypothetical protein [Magnetospirillum molischianum]CCG43294.1 conserved hypothetical protein [Magnetospirillum molischianum DSM 120]
MTKMLNLDAVKPKTERVLKLKGQEHAQAPLSVGDFIDNARASRRLAEKPDLVEEFELVLGMVGRSFPTVPETDLRALTFEQLSTILSWSQTDESAEDAEGKE